MSEYDRLCELLPSLYRPEPDDDTLVNRLLDGWGFVLDGASVQVQHVLRSHWFDTADAALLDAHYQRDREERKLPAANIRSVKDQKELNAYPYITDLARVAALLNLPPWLEPTNFREGVEEYRGRIRDLVDAYRLGLTTVPALRRLIEAALPEDETAPLAEQRWPFAIEEPVALKTRRVQGVTPDAQEGELVGPLFRWTLDDVEGTPVVYLQGAGATATERPALERFTPGATPAGITLGYRGSLSRGQTLRLSPARRSWLVVAGVLQSSAPETSDNSADDPAVNGPWAAIAGAPSGVVRALAEAVDHSVWLATDDGGTFGLARYDGAAVQSVTSGAPASAYRALVTRGDAVYLGTDLGLFKARLFPDEGQPFVLAAVPAVTAAVRALAVLADGRLACATNNGVSVLNADDTQAELLFSGVDARALLCEPAQRYFATAKALLLELGGRLFRYEGAALAENKADWVALEASDAAGAESPLPQITALARTPDGYLWLGTQRGLARYGARSDRTTVLEAFPDLGGAAVHSLVVDARGMLWIAGADGLFRYDGRDLAEYRFDEGRWASLGDAGQLYPDEISSRERGHWRFAASADRWERFTPELARFEAANVARRAGASTDVSALLFSDSLRAELGSFDGSTFSSQQSVGNDQFVVHVKPDESRIVNGGLPALPSGSGTLRYLELEAPNLVAPPGRPWWSREGRLFLPPQSDAPWPGHFRGASSPWHADGHFNQAMFAYPPSARVWLEYPAAPKIGIRVRLFRRRPAETIDPAVIERVLQLLIRAKAASIPLELAVEGAVVKGG